MIKYFEEKLNFYKLLLMLFFTADSGCVAWAFTQYGADTSQKAIFNIAAIICLTLSIIVFIVKIKYYQNKIKEDADD